MGLFDFFKKKTEAKELTLFNLDKGCVFKYDLADWVIKDVSEYDWGNNIKTREYYATNGTAKKYFHISKNPEVTIDVSETIALNSINPSIRQNIIDFDKPISSFVFQGETYQLTHDDFGYCKSIYEEDSSEFVNWIFHNNDETKFVSISRWGETEIDSTFGFYVKEFEISDLLHTPD